MIAACDGGLQGRREPLREASGDRQAQAIVTQKDAFRKFRLVSIMIVAVSEMSEIRSRGSDAAGASKYGSTGRRPSNLPRKDGCCGVLSAVTCIKALRTDDALPPSRRSPIQSIAKSFSKLPASQAPIIVVV